MKCIFLLFMLLPLIGFSQSRTLESLSSGNLVFTDILYDNDWQVVGYFYIYETETPDRETAKYEYVLLDKNLNPSFNMEHTETVHKRLTRDYVSARYMGDRISISSKYFINKFSVKYGTPVPRAMFNSIQIISLKDKKIEGEYFLEDDKMQDVPELSDALFEQYKKKSNFNDNKLYGVSFDGFTGYLAFLENESVSMYDDKFNMLWKHEYGDNIFIQSFVKDNYSAGIEISDKKSKSKFYKKFHAFGLDSKDKSFEYLIQDGHSENNYETYVSRKIGDKFLLVGMLGDSERYAHVLSGKSLGLYRIILDINGKEIDKKKFLWADVPKEYGLNKRGQNKQLYSPYAKAAFVFRDGSSAFLFEMTKETIGAAKPLKTLDMYLVQFDKNFEMTNIEQIDKSKTKGVGSDYRFSQYMNDNNDAVFYFEDRRKNEETGKKEWILGINKIISGKYSYEEIPTSSEDFVRDILPAKEGYILIRESSDKGTEIRLEKLNL
ncbi:MAG: hypothetical protein ACK5MG_04370 [Bacteroidales bacterium]